MILLSSPRRRRAYDGIEILEARIAPATLVSLNSVTGLLTVQGDYVDDGSSTVQPGAPESLSITISNGTLSITDSLHGVTAVGAGLSQAGVGQVNVPIASLIGDLTIDTGTGTDSLSFAGALALATNKSLTAHASGTISFTPTSTVSALGAGKLTVTADRDISIATGATVQVANGDLTLMALGTGGGNYSGINVGGTISSAGSGRLLITGTGGNVAANNHGIDMHGVISGGAGLVTLTGTGGQGIDNNTGIFASSGSISAGIGGIVMTGMAGGDQGQSLGIDLSINVSTAANATLVTNNGILFSAGAHISASDGTADIHTASAGAGITLGQFQQATLGISDAMLAAIDARKVIIGSAQAGDINLVNAGLSSNKTLELKSGDSVTGVAGLSLTPGRDLSIEAVNGIQLDGIIKVPGTLSLTGVGGDIDIGLPNAANEFNSVHVVRGAAVELRESDGFSFDAQVTSLLTLNSSSTITQAGTITGGADLFKLGTGTLQLNQANVLGDTTIADGTIVFSNSGALGTSTVTLGDLGSGSTNVSLLGAGGVTLANPIAVPSILGGGVVKIGSIETGSGAAVNYEGFITLNRATTLLGSAAAGTFFKEAISGNVGTLTISGGARVAIGGATNTFVGNVQIVSSSTLEVLPGADAIPDTSGVNVEADSFFRLSKGLGESEAIASLTGDGTVSTGLAASLAPQALTLIAGGIAFQFDGFIKDGAASLALTKEGPSSATLAGELSYSGSTVIKSGTLVISNPDSSNVSDKTPLIDIRPGATLDVTSLSGGGLPQTLTLAPGQTLIGSGTIIGNITGTGKVSPGSALAPGILTITGNFNPTGEVDFRVLSPYTTAGAHFDQIVIGGSGLLDLSGAKLRLSGGDGVLGAGTMIKLFANNGPSATVAGTSPTEGALIGTGSATFGINYNAGNGSDVVLTASPGVVSLSATFAASRLVISDTAGRPHRLIYHVEGPNLLIDDLVEFFGAAPAGAQLLNNGHTLSLPVAQVRSLQINGGGSDDSLTVDFASSSTKLPTGGFVFNGGSQASSAGDQLVLLGTNEGPVTYTYTGQRDGSVVLGRYGKIILAETEAVVNTGNASSQFFNLPKVLNHAMLADDGLDNGLTRLSGSTFPTTDFTSPILRGATSGVTINPGSALDDITLGLLPDFDDNLFIGSPVNRFDKVLLASSLDLNGSLEIDTETLTLPAGLHLSAIDGELGVSNGTIDGVLSGGLSLIKTVGVSPGNPLTLNGANTHTGETVVVEGPLILGDGLAVQKSTVRIFTGQEVQFKAGIGTFAFGGLAGTGNLALVDVGGTPVSLQAGENTSTYAGVLSGLGNLTKIGNGILTLTGKNTHTGTFLGKGILQINSDAALGSAAIPLVGDGGTLQASVSTTVSRGIVLQSATTFQAAAGKTLTLAGFISGAGDLLIGDTGTVLVTGQANTNTGSVELGGGASQVVNGVTISTPGVKSGVMVKPGAVPGEVAMIDLTGVNVPVTLVIKNPATGTVTVNQIVSNDNTAIKAITLGTNVKLGDGVDDGVPDLLVKGKLTTLTASDVNANTIIQIGKGLTYLDTYKNVPNVTLRDVLGPGVVIDVTGNGVSGELGGIGGGGLGKIIVNKWAEPGLIKTSQSIKSFTVKSGDSKVSIQVDPTHLGTMTNGGIGVVSIPAGQWAGANMQVEGVVAQFLTKGLAEGSTITAGAFGTINIKGNYAGTIISDYDPSVNVPVKNKPPRIIATGAIGNVTIGGDFTGVINADGKVGNVTLTGTARFMGTLRGAAIGNITAASFTGTADVGQPNHTITSIGKIGNIIAKTGGLTDYIIAAGTDLGSDAIFGGVADTFTSFFLTTPTVKTAVSIGSITIKGVVTGTTIAAGVDPGAMGIYGDGDDTVMTAPMGFTGKTKIGAMSFDANIVSNLGFAESTLLPVGNAFEAQTLTSIKFGKGASNPLTNPQFRKLFVPATYIDSGSSSIIVQLLT